MKKRLSILFLSLLFLLVQAAAVKPYIAYGEEGEFSVRVVVNSFDKVLAEGISSKSNALQAAEQVLDGSNKTYKVTEASWGGKYISQVEEVKEKHFGGYDGWLYAVERAGKYIDISTGMDSFLLENGDKLLLYYGDFNTLLVNKLDFSTDKEGQQLQISLNNSYTDYTTGKPVVVPVTGVSKVKIDGREYSMEGNKVSLPQGLNYGAHSLDISDFRNDRCPGVIADKIEFEFKAAEGGQNSGEDVPDNSKLPKDIKAEVKQLKNYIAANSEDPWAALSLRKFGIKAKDSFAKENHEYILSEGVKNYSNTDLEKLILNLTALGYTPYNFAGQNLVEELLNREEGDLLINDAVFALFVYNYANVEEGYNLTEDKLINFILDKRLQYADGDEELYGWALSGDKLNPDITAAVITALAPYAEDKHPKVKSAVEKAVNSLSLLQSENGTLADSYGSFSESLSFSILALTAAGENPEGERFTKAKGDLVTALLSFKGTESQYKHSQEAGNNYMATEQALRAFYALSKFQEQGKYNFYSSDIRAKELSVYSDHQENERSEAVGKADEVVSNKQELLPQTGSAVDYQILIFSGLILIALGAYLIVGRSLKDKKN